MGQWLCGSERYFRRLGESPDKDFKDGREAPDDPEAASRRREISPMEHDLHFFSADAFVDLARFTKDGKIDAQAVADAIRHLPVTDQFAESYDHLSPLLAANARQVEMQRGSQTLENEGRPTIQDVSRQGTLPWRVLQLYDLSVQSLSKHDVKMGMY